MKKLSFLMALLLAVMLVIPSAFATDTIDVPDTTEVLKSFGLTDEEAAKFAAIIANVDESLSEEDFQALLAEFLTEEGAQTESGTLGSDGTFTHPAGFTLKVPEGWNVLEQRIGADVTMTGPSEEEKVAPVISVLVLDTPREELDTLKQEDYDTLYSKSLKNYQFVALDEFPYLDVTAHEFVCTYGDNPEAMMMQYQLYFNKDGRAFIITMTTLAEEAAHDNALTAYDTMLEEFTTQAGQSAQDGQGLG